MRPVLALTLSTLIFDAEMPMRIFTVLRVQKPTNQIEMLIAYWQDI